MMGRLPPPLRPTPHGGIAVAWQRFSAADALLRVALPKGVRAAVTFPIPGAVVRQRLPAQGCPLTVPPPSLRRVESGVEALIRIRIQAGWG